MYNIHDFDQPAGETTKPIYSLRTNKNGEEYLKKIDEINIEEDLNEKQKEIQRINEILKENQNKIKLAELVDELNDEESLKDIEELAYNNDLDLYELINKTRELEEFYNKFPEDIRKKYKNIKSFQNEYLPKLIKEQKEKISERKKEESIKNNENESLKAEIEKLKEEISKKIGGEENV